MLNKSIPLDQSPLHLFVCELNYVDLAVGRTPHTCCGRYHVVVICLSNNQHIYVGCQPGCTAGPRTEDLRSLEPRDRGKLALKQLLDYHRLHNQLANHSNSR